MTQLLHKLMDIDEMKIIIKDIIKDFENNYNIQFISKINEINNNVISSTGTNADITLTPQGTGSVIINNTQSFIVPVGTTLRGSSPRRRRETYGTRRSRQSQGDTPGRSPRPLTARARASRGRAVPIDRWPPWPSNLNCNCPLGK